MGDAEASPTPTPRSELRLEDSGPVEQYALPCSTDLEESKPAIELEKAWRESYVMHCWPILKSSGGKHLRRLGTYSSASMYPVALKL